MGVFDEAFGKKDSENKIQPRQEGLERPSEKFSHAENKIQPRQEGLERPSEKFSHAENMPPKNSATLKGRKYGKERVHFTLRLDARVVDLLEVCALASGGEFTAADFARHAIAEWFKMKQEKLMSMLPADSSPRLTLDQEQPPIDRVERFKQRLAADRARQAPTGLKIVSRSEVRPHE